MAAKADVQTPLGVTLGKIQPGRVVASHLASNAVTTAKIADDAVTKNKIGEQLVKAALIAGGAAGNHTVTGIATADNLVMVLHNTAGTLANLTSEFTISAANTINNAAGTDTTSDQLLVIYQDNT